MSGSYKKYGSRIELPIGTLRTFKEFEVLSELTSFHYDRYTEHHKKTLQKKYEFWDQVYANLDIPLGAALELTPDKKHIIVKRVDRRSLQIKQQNLEITRLQLQIQTQEIIINSLKEQKEEEK